VLRAAEKKTATDDSPDQPCTGNGALAGNNIFSDGQAGGIVFQVRVTPTGWGGGVLWGGGGGGVGGGRTKSKQMQGTKGLLEDPPRWHQYRGNAHRPHHTRKKGNRFQEIPYRAVSANVDKQIKGQGNKASMQQKKKSPGGKRGGHNTLITSSEKSQQQQRRLINIILIIFGRKRGRGNFQNR